jgi:nucleotide-binding universal stress UspA family protein
MFETIVVPLDGSELAERALGPALELRQKLGAKIILVRAVESLAQRLVQTPAVIETAGAAAANVELMEDVVEAEQAEAKTYLQALIAKAGNIDGEAVIVEGKAADAIVELAKQRKAGLIVMSSHGHGGLGRLIFGSTTDEVLQHSAVPVLLIRSRRDD